MGLAGIQAPCEVDPGRRTGQTAGSYRPGFTPRQGVGRGRVLDEGLCRVLPRQSLDALPLVGEVLKPCEFSRVQVGHRGRRLLYHAERWGCVTGGRRQAVVLPGFLEHGLAQRPALSAATSSQDEKPPVRRCGRGALIQGLLRHGYRVVTL